MSQELWFKVFLYVHLVTMAWGVAGTTIANLMIRFESDRWLRVLRLEKGPWLPSTLFPRLTRLITISIGLLAVSGIGLGYIAGGENLNLKGLAVKLILVSIVFINGMHLALKLEPELEKAAPPTPGGKESPEFSELMGRVRTHGIISLVGWYLIVAISIFLGG